MCVCVCVYVCVCVCVCVCVSLFHEIVVCCTQELKDLCYYYVHDISYFVVQDWYDCFKEQPMCTHLILSKCLQENP